MIPAMIVPILRRPELLYRMLDSIDYPVKTLIIIDNGRALNTSRGWPVEHVQSTQVITMPANLGVAGSWNLGIKSAPFAPWWLVVNFDAVFEPGSLKRFREEAEQGSLLLSGGQPPWCAFAIGDQVVERVGLFDEGFHPAYCEDTDYAWRCEMSGVPVVTSTIPVQHTNSSTLAAGFAEMNARSYPANVEYLQGKVAAGDCGEGRWLPSRRRALSWD